MRIRILGGGWYGCHLAVAMLRAGHDVELHEKADHLFAGASGGNPARCHLGFHYPRSGLTQDACQMHHREFMAEYGALTMPVPLNVYAVADHDSLVDFSTYRRAFQGRVEFITIRPEEFGLRNVEGAMMTGERHVIISMARDYFTNMLDGIVKYGVSPILVDDPRWELTIDCTFCANDEERIDRFEPCVTVLLNGPTMRAVTIMDGPFGSIYPWDHVKQLCSLTSARYTPISKECRSWAEARHVLDAQKMGDLEDRAQAMLNQMEHFWPDVRDYYKVADFKLTIRAMPRSAADARLVDIVRVGERALRVRAGKIDAIFHAEKLVKEQIRAWRREINRVVTS